MGAFSLDTYLMLWLGEVLDTIYSLNTKSKSGTRILLSFSLPTILMLTPASEVLKLNAKDQGRNLRHELWERG